MREFKKETVRASLGNEVSYSPERGGIITSLKLQGKEVLYLDEATFEDPKMNVRGGIPILFPNAGPIDSPQFPHLLQHGFARTTPWQSEKGKEGFTEILLSSIDTKKVFPYEFKLSVSGQFKSDGSFTITESVENTGKETMPISMGLHPYFKVPRNSKRDIKFNFRGGDVAQKDGKTAGHVLLIIRKLWK